MAPFVLPMSSATKATVPVVVNVPGVGHVTVVDPAVMAQPVSPHSASAFAGVNPPGGAVTLIICPARLLSLNVAPRNSMADVLNFIGSVTP